MLEAATPGTLDRYRDFIKKLSRRYGPQAWAIIYQADTRARRMLVLWVYRNGLEANEKTMKIINASRATGVACDLALEMNVDKPWDFVYQMFTDQKYKEFWHENVDTPATDAKLGLGTPFVTGEARIGEQPPTVGALSAAPSRPAARQLSDAAPPWRDGGGPAAKRQRQGQQQRQQYF